MRWLIALAATIAAAAWLAQRRADSAVPEVQQGATLLDDAMTAIDPSTYATPAVTQDVANGNVQAWLAMLQWSEGTAGPDPYSVLFGGGHFDNGYVDHPRIATQFTNRDGQKLWTTAAGAYQLMAVSPIPGTDRTTHVDTWDRLQRKLSLPDFSPASQDACAIELTRERGALGDVMAGNIAAAIAKCAPVWASLPGDTNYAQAQQRLSSLLAAYQAGGGITSEA